MSSGFVLRVESGTQAGQTFPLTAPSVVIGRHAEAGIVLNDTQVSRRHAQVELLADRAILTDLNSANGTFINGRRLDAPQPLNPGDLIQLGESRLRVEGPALATQIVPTRVADDYAATHLADAAGRESIVVEAGTVLNGRYRLERAIGQGGFARVFLASDLALKRPIAVKVLNVELVEETADDFLARFANEAQAIANLDHPNILAIHDFGQLAATAFLVMPYVSGGTLGDALRSKGRLAPRLVSRYLRQMAAALDYAHRRNLVHRDIKPQNMLLRTDDDHLLLADFGIAKVLSATSAQSRTGVIGTIAYMAPEQFRGQVSRATDIYALGCVLFQCLTGKLPFGGSTEEVMFAHISAPVPLLAAYADDLPPAVQAVVTRALAKRPEERFASASELAEAFDAALAGSLPTRAVDPPTLSADPAPQHDAGRTRIIAPPGEATPSRNVPPPPIATPPPPPPPQGEIPPRQFTRLAELEQVPERKPARPATSLTIPAVILAVLAVVPAIVTILFMLNDASLDEAVAYYLAGIGLGVVAIWLIRAAALQRTDPAQATAGRSLLRALAPVLASIGVAAVCLLIVGPNLFGEGFLLWGVALMLTVVGPLIVPTLSKTRPVGAALDRAAELVLIAFGIVAFPLVRRLLYFFTPYSEEEAIFPAAMICLGGVFLAFILQRIARRFIPGFGNWAWLAALVLALAGIVLENMRQ